LESANGTLDQAQVAWKQPASTRRYHVDLSAIGTTNTIPSTTECGAIRSLRHAV
jgi:hypothetical protein